MVDINLIVDTISQIGSVALDAAQDNAIDNVNEEVNQALAFERKQERKHIARVFAELGIDRQKAINLLVFEWDTDRRDAEELMLEAHRIYWPLERLKRHLRNEDWTTSEISDFLHDYEVARQLRTNRRLSDLTAADLVDWLQKNQDRLHCNVAYLSCTGDQGRLATLFYLRPTPVCTPNSNCSSLSANVSNSIADTRPVMLAPWFDTLMP